MRMTAFFFFTILSDDFTAALKAEILELSFLLEQGSVNWATCSFLKIKLNWNTAIPFIYTLQLLSCHESRVE